MPRRQLGRQLRFLREQAGLKLEQVAAEVGCSQTRLSRIENAKGRTKPKPEEIRQMAELFGLTDPAAIDTLLGMLADSQQPGWWEKFEDVLPTGLDVYFGLETDARTERGWEPLLVHGLLQTPDYARAVMNAPRSHRPSDIDDLVQVRTERKKLITRSEAPLELWAVLDENVLRRPIGGVDAMREQLHHLRELAELPNLTVQIFPFTKPSHPGLGGAFSLLDFEDDPTVVYVDNPVGNLYLEKPRDVRRFTSCFDLLRATALDPDDSTALIEHAAQEMQ